MSTSRAYKKSHIDDLATIFEQFRINHHVSREALANLSNFDWPFIYSYYIAASTNFLDTYSFVLIQRRTCINSTSHTLLYINFVRHKKTWQDPEFISGLGVVLDILCLVQTCQLWVSLWVGIAGLIFGFHMSQTAFPDAQVFSGSWLSTRKFPIVRPIVSGPCANWSSIQHSPGNCPSERMPLAGQVQREFPQNFAEPAKTQAQHEKTVTVISWLFLSLNIIS